MALDGTVVAATRLIDVSPSTLFFGDVGIGYALTKVITVKKTGNSLLTVNNITSSNAVFQVTGGFPFSVSPSSPGELVEVTFLPTGAGLQSGQVKR